jgi:membrane-associated phospholipid phosphatase
MADAAALCLSVSAARSVRRLSRLRTGCRDGSKTIMQKKPLFIYCVIGSVICILSYFYLDRSTAYYFKTLDPKIFAVFSIITEFGNSKWYLVISALLFVIFKFIYVNMTLAYRSIFVFLAISISGLVTDIMKFIFARYRPEMLFEKNLYGFDLLQIHYKMTSFPSGHANTITALMLAVYFIFPKYKIVYFPIALLVIASRVVLCDHFLSDVIFGAFLAVVTTFYLKDYFVCKHSEMFVLQKPADLAASSALSG